MKQVLLVDVARVVSGGTPKTGVPEYWDGDVLWATPKDLSGLKTVRINSTPRKLSRAGLKASSAEILPVNSVLFSSRAPIGLIAVNSVPMATNQGFKSFVPDAEKLDAGYLYRWLEWKREWLQSLGVGATFKEVSKATVSRIEIPLPPLDEQRRIAAILDKADALRTKRREALAHLDTLTHSIFHSMFGDPVTNPQNRPRLALPEVGHLYSGGTPSKASSDNWAGEVPWFSPKDIKAAFLEDSMDHISPRVTESSSLKLLPAKTVVFVVRGMILAHSFPVAMILRPATINQDLKAIRLTRPLEPEFLLACLQAQHGHAVSLVETAAHGTKKLTADALSKIYVFDVPIERQQEFARQVSAVERLKELHRKHLTELDALFASLQHRAFKGEL